VHSPATLPDTLLPWRSGYQARVMDDDRCENDEDRYGTVNFYEKDTDSSEEWGWRND